METFLPLIRKLLVLGVWVYVGYQMLPAARSTDRNGFIWYFVGLFAFYIPFLLIAFMPPVLMLIAMTNGMEIPSSFFNAVGIVAFFLGVSAGFACLNRAKTAALVLPKR